MKRIRVRRISIAAAAAVLATTLVLASCATSGRFRLDGDADGRVLTCEWAPPPGVFPKTLMLVFTSAVPGDVACSFDLEIRSAGAWNRVFSTEKDLRQGYVTGEVDTYRVNLNQYRSGLPVRVTAVYYNGRGDPVDTEVEELEIP